MSIEVRQAVSDDAEHLARLCMGVQAVHIEMHPEFFREPAHEELVVFFRDRLAEVDYTALLAWAAAEPVGYVLAHFVRRDENVFVRERAYLEIEHLYVAQTHRRRRIGGRLVAQAIDLARARGVEVVQLNVWARNERAIATFEALGFEQRRHIMTLKAPRRPGPATC